MFSRDALSGFGRLSGPERFVCVLALMGLPLSSFLLWSLGARRVLALLDRVPVRRRQRELGPARAAAIVGATADRLPGAATCLPRSVTATALLRCAGHEAAVRLGVRRIVGGMEAHAWTEVDGMAVGEPDSAWTLLEATADSGAARP